MAHKRCILHLRDITGEILDIFLQERVDYKKRRDIEILKSDYFLFLRIGLANQYVCLDCQR